MPRLQPRTLQRLALFIGAVLCLLAAYLLMRPVAVPAVAQQRQAWQQHLSQPQTQAALDPQAVHQRYGISADPGAHSLSWQLEHPQQLGESLTALSAAGHTLHHIDIRRDSGRYQLTARTQP